jgi:hypothetical protein
MPLEIGSKSFNSRKGSIGSASFALDPNAKFMSPRPVPEPRAHSPAPSSIRRGRTFDVADRSAESSASTFTRLLNKASMNEGLRSRSGSPSRTANLRSAMSLSNLKAAQMHHDHYEEARDRKRLFQKLQKSNDRGREISRPMPHNRSAAPDSNVLIGTARSVMSSRTTSRATSRSASPAPSLQVASLQSHPTVEAAEYSPLRTYLADRSWQNSPLPPTSVGDFPGPLPPAQASSIPRSGAREPSPLRAQVQEDNSIDIPQEIIKEAEAVDDDFNFRFEFEPVASGSSSSSGLSVPPSRGLLDTSVFVLEASDVPPHQALTYMSPTFGSTPHVAILPTSSHLHVVPRPPARIASTAPEDEEENFPKSHFSMWSNSTSAMSPMSPMSEFSDSPGSPCFSSLASLSSAPLSPAFSSLRDPHSDPRPSEPAEFACTSFRNRAAFDSKMDSKMDDELVKVDTATKEHAVNESGQPLRLNSSTFPGYSLPEEKYASQDTIRRSAGPAAESPTLTSNFNSEPKRKDAWEEQISSMDDMMQDLGYLSELIIPK